MANGLRKVITLNPKNPKEKAILEVLDNQYNYAEFIRNVLYEYIINNNILHHDNSITTPLSYHDTTITTPLSHNDNSIQTSLSHDDNKDNFLIDVSALEDIAAKMDLSEQEDPSKNALDFLKNSF